MDRRYTREAYIEFILAANAAVPDLCIGTDVLVGSSGVPAHIKSAKPLTGFYNPFHDAWVLIEWELNADRTDRDYVITDLQILLGDHIIGNTTHLEPTFIRALNDGDLLATAVCRSTRTAIDAFSKRFPYESTSSYDFEVSDNEELIRVLETRIEISEAGLEIMRMCKRLCRMFF